MKKSLLKSLLLVSVVVSATGVAWAESDISEGSVIMKVRGQFAFPQSKQKYNPGLGSTNVTSNGKKFISTGVGAEVAASYFLTDEIAGELSIGMIGYKMGNPVVVGVNAGAANQYSHVSTGKAKKRLWFVPVTALVQYHMMPEEKFSPYVGAGYSYMFTPSSSGGVVKLTAAHGPVLQAGFDLWDNDDLAFNVDLKKYWAQTKVSYKTLQNTSGGQALKSKAQIDPFVMSAGVSVRM